MGLFLSVPGIHGSIQSTPTYSEKTQTYEIPVYKKYGQLLSISSILFEQGELSDFI